MTAAAAPSSRSVLISLLLLRSYPGAAAAWWYRLARPAVAGCYAYALLVVVLMALENRLLYRPCTAADYWRPLEPGSGVEEVEWTLADGTPIHAWWLAPADWRPGQGALLHCHGNGCNLSVLGPLAEGWRRDHHLAVLLFDYPGYGRSGGAPSEAGCYAAADAAYDWLTGVKGVPPNRVLIYGHSLGGGVATDLASRRPHRGLILTSTFSSFPDTAQARVWVVPACWLAHNRFESALKIARCTAPVFVAHGTADHTIPYELGERLFAAVAAPQKRFLRVENGSHDLIGDPALLTAALLFIRQAELGGQGG